DARSTFPTPSVFAYRMHGSMVETILRHRASPVFRLSAIHLVDCRQAARYRELDPPQADRRQTCLPVGRRNIPWVNG
ncbi:MAG: hypothetical protein ACE1ZN_03865, partial [Dehalococcoidia bacterium]